jgi:hypothetical protein
MNQLILDRSEHDLVSNRLSLADSVYDFQWFAVVLDRFFVRQDVDIVNESQAEAKSYITRYVINNVLKLL